MTMSVACTLLQEHTLAVADDGAEGTSTARLTSPPHLTACLSTVASRSAEHCVTRVTRDSGDGRTYRETYEHRDARV